MKSRDKYLNQLIGFKDKDWVKIIVGVRRCGKSTLLELMKNYLLSNNVSSSQIIKINFEHFGNEHLKNGIDLHNHIQSLIINQNKYYLFIDEVQEVAEWSKAVNSIRVAFNIDIYVTGSNSKIFIGEHLTYLAGRYISINMYPLSISEYTNFLDIKNIDESTYQSFIEGAFPAYVLEGSDYNKQLIINDLYNSIFYRDILLRNNYKNESIFNRVSKYIFENIGKPISIKKIADTMTSNGDKVANQTIDNYVKAMMDAFVVYHCPRFDVLGKELLKTQGKYYTVDFGLRNHSIGRQNLNTGFIYENFIFLELIKQGYKVQTGKVGRNYEIDFVAQKGKEILYIQVAETIIDQITRDREARPFSYIDEKHKKILVTTDRYKYSTHQFDHMNTFEFIDFIQN